MSSWMESGRPRLGLALRGPAEAAAIEPLLFGYLTALPRVTAEDGVVNLVLCVPPNRPGVARVDIALIDSSANDQTRELTQVLAEVGRGDWPGRACGLSPRVAEVVALTTRPEQRGPTVAPVRSCARPTTAPGRTSCRPGCLPSGVVQRGRPAAGGWGSPTIGRCGVGRRTRRVVIPESPRRRHGQRRPCGPCQSRHPEASWAGHAGHLVAAPVARCPTLSPKVGRGWFRRAWPSDGQVPMRCGSAGLVTPASTSSIQ